MDNVLVLGSGGREHALAAKLTGDSDVNQVFCAPGNGGTAGSKGIKNLDYSDFADLEKKVERNSVDLIVVGPEKPLADGVKNYFEKTGVPVFGFDRETARLEASKSFADRFKRDHGVLAPDFRSFSDYSSALDYLKEELSEEGTSRLWVKADELCGGKGVIGIETLEEGRDALWSLLKDNKCGVGERVIIQEDIPGEEITVQAITDGEEFVLTPSSQDHKKRNEGGRGPNTGGMGAYAPAPPFNSDVEEIFREEILSPTAKGLIEENLGGPGVVYFGLGLSSDGVPKVLEYNVRFGDPEAQAIMRLLDSDLYPILKSSTEGDLSRARRNVIWKDRVAVCLILSVKGYPRDYGNEKYPIQGVDKAESLPGIRVYHSGTMVENGTLFTDGGRILSLTAAGSSLAEARERVYGAAEVIDFRDKYYRKDIGAGQDD